MYLELVMDICKSNKSFREICDTLPAAMDELNGIFLVKELTELS